jgi:macrolide-specific efflux system membrane fusion protein
MADATLVAPAGGLVTEVNLTVGQAVSGGSRGGTGQPGATTATTTSTAQVVIVGTESWTIDVTVDDTDVALIAVGDQAELTLEDSTETVFGVVSEIGLISTSTGGVAAYPVSIEITGQPEGVYDGVEADVAIVYERRTDVLTVPSAAVRTVDGESVVTQAGDDGEEVTTVVTVGETVGDLTEITAGLAEGDEVLVTVVTQTEQGTGTGTQQGGFPEGFDPSQMELPEGFDPSQLPGGGQMPGGSNG